MTQIPNNLYNPRMSIAGMPKAVNRNAEYSTTPIDFTATVRCYAELAYAMVNRYLLTMLKVPAQIDHNYMGDLVQREQPPK